MRRLVLGGLCSLVFSVLSAQAVAPPTVPAAPPGSEAGKVKSEAAVPKEYSPEEFPPWALEVRRAEIVAVGSLPVTSLFAGLGFDYVYYLAKGAPAAHVPWPLGPGTSSWTEAANSADLAAKNLTLVAASVGMAVTIAAADWLIGALTKASSP